MSKFYLARKNPVTYQELIRLGYAYPDSTEKERVENDECRDGDEVYKEHKWLLYPKHSVAVQQGGKSYMFCLNCGRHSHL